MVASVTCTMVDRFRSVGGWSARLLALTVLTAVTSGTAYAQAFGRPVRLTQTGGYGWASSGIDAAGNATAVWASVDGITFSTHRPVGGWAAPTTFSAGTTINPTLHVAASGLATVATYDASNIWVTDKPASGSWGTPVQLLTAEPLGNPFAPSVKPVLFVENAAGDAAIVFRGGQGFPFIGVMRRMAGGNWLPAENVAVPQSNYVTLSSAAIGEGGDVIVTWGNHEVTCTFRGCHDTNFTIQAATEHTAGAGFQTSPVLLSYPDYTVRSAIDPKGRAVVLAQSPGSQGVDALVQLKPGAAWSAAASAYSSPTSRPQLAGIAAGPHARATAILFNPDINTGNVTAVSGALLTNAWTGPTNLSLTDSSPVIVAPQIASSPLGGTVAVWLDADGTIRAAERKTAPAPWQSTQTITVPAPQASAACSAAFGLVWTCNMMLAPSMNAKGHAVILYLQTQPDGSTPLFAATN